ncbi:hypothetical protein [Aeromonas rivipollensis]|uniref:hypothetical protein n=1 Tax=Aeromonas rivipollensis TaxID=948519 RepID=UPI0038D01A25
MQVLTTSLFDDEIEIVIDGATSDDRARMTVMPAMYQDTIKAMVDGETDGRGISMGPDGYTALGVAGALRRAGLEVSGDEPPPPDKDGAAGQGKTQYDDCELEPSILDVL